VVISGSKAACERAVTRAEAFGLRAIPLKVAGAFHSPLMQTAADALAEVLTQTSIAPPRIPVFSNVTAQPHADVDTIRRLLCEQVTRPVRWQECVEALFREGVSQFIEVGPNRVLTGLMRKIDRSRTCQTVNGQEAIERFSLSPSG
jgi:[acyl-carrier-protein] S-malonyltransferase